MDFPSKVASYAARPLSRPRGVGASLLRSSTLRPFVRRFRPGRTEAAPAGAGAVPAGSVAHVPQAVSSPTVTARSRRNPLNVKDVSDGASHVLVLGGELDGSSVATLEGAISRACAGGARAITLDLSQLTFIDSSGLWTITLARKWCERHGYGLSLIPGPEPVQRVFEMTGLSDVLPFEKDGADSERATSERPHPLD